MSDSCITGNVAPPTLNADGSKEVKCSVAVPLMGLMSAADEHEPAGLVM